MLKKNNRFYSLLPFSLLFLFLSWLFSRSINAWDSKVSILFNLLLARSTILLCFFFLFFVISKNSLFIPIAKENARVKYAAAIPVGTPITYEKEILDTPTLVVEKQLKH